MKKINNIDIRFNAYNIILDFISEILSNLNLINSLYFASIDNLENNNVIEKILDLLVSILNEYIEKKIIKIRDITDIVVIEIIIPIRSIKTINTITIYNINFSLFLSYILNNENKKILIIKKNDDIFTNKYLISFENLFNSIEKLNKLIDKLNNKLD
jgi:hypothetical protein